MSNVTSNADVRARQTTSPNRERPYGEPEFIHPAQREAKPGLATTEFYVTIVMVVGVLIATYANSDTLSHKDGWMFASWIAIAYIVSRGLAKLASSNRTIVRDRLD